MLDDAQIEKRVAALEQAVLELQRQLAVKPSSEEKHSLQLIATVSPFDESDFLEVLEYGRAYRQSDRPVGDTDETEAPNRPQG